jgi:hypothetical protein
MRFTHSRSAALAVVGANAFPTYWSCEEDKQTPAVKKDDKMITVFDMLKTAARNYAAFRQTRDEIANLPLDVALDIGIYPGDADRIAREAVYGKAA